MNQAVPTVDGSNTLFSVQYKQNFHDEKTGALKEALTKHVIPALDFHKNESHVKILDICFGLGYNTLATLYYVKKNKLDIKLTIYSPELDESLIDSLGMFEYPKEFEELHYIIEAICKTHCYHDERLSIEVAIQDARDYIKGLDNINIVYQDAFSSEVNKELWSVEYFEDIWAICSENAILTTYSVSTPVRLSMYKAGFEIYEIKPVKKKQTLAFKSLQDIKAKYIDMELKQINNKDAEAIYDTINNA